MSFQIESLLDDIPTDLARRAHYNTSFVPDRRAEQERADYANTLATDYAELLKLCDTDKKKAQLESEFLTYREGYRRRFVAVLVAKSRCISPMITGPANFPTERNRKRFDTERRRYGELSEFRERALKAIRRELCPEARPIMAGDSDAITRLESEIAEAEARHASMKSDPSLRLSGLSLSNSSANIRRMKSRLEAIRKAKSLPETTIQGQAARIEDSPADNRIRLYFPGKPAIETRDELKRGGFRWAPSLGCWQAYRNFRSIDLAKKIAGL